MRKFHTFFTDKATTGIDKPALCSNFDKILLSMDADSSSSFTVKFQGSMSRTMPDFTAAQTQANQWDYIEVVDMQDGSAIDGDTGVTLVATTDHRMFQANVDGLVWVNVRVTAISGGAVTSKCVLLNAKK
jgi:hypothetical protein